MVWRVREWRRNSAIEKTASRAVVSVQVSMIY